MRIKKIRFLSVLLSIVLFGSSLATVPAYAAANVNRQISVSELTGLEITDLAEPVVGQPLDQKAVVKSAEGITWEIPVIWTDDTGRVATVTEAGHKYLPTFAFYVPAGYRLKDTGANGSFSVRLPAFASGLFGTGNLLFMADSATGITYITWNFSDTSGRYAAYPQNTAGNDSSDSIKSSSDRGNNNNAQSSDNANSIDNTDSNDNDDDSNSDSNDQNEQDKYEDVYIHCASNTIKKYGAENLAWFVRLIKEEIEPRAIAALLDGFPAFKKAASIGEIGEQISLYIYDLKVEPQNEKNIEGAAYVSAAYFDDVYKYRMGVNIENIFVLKQNGEYDFAESKQEELENTIVHELMHGLMDDYNRTGMASFDFCFPYNPNPTGQYNAFPKWFVEGSASTVENCFIYQSAIFDEMLGKNKRYTGDMIRDYFGKKRIPSLYIRQTTIKT